MMGLEFGNRRVLRDAQDDKVEEGQRAFIGDGFTDEWDSDMLRSVSRESSPCAEYPVAGVV